MIIISDRLYDDCLEALQHMEDEHPSKRWTLARKLLVLAMMEACERDFQEDLPTLLRPQI